MDWEPVGLNMSGIGLRVMRWHYRRRLRASLCYDLRPGHKLKRTQTRHCIHNIDTAPVVMSIVAKTTLRFHILFKRNITRDLLLLA